MGIKKLHDPAWSRTSQAPRLPIDVGQWHEYAVRWDEQVAEFSVDGEHVRTCARPPTYPLQIMIAVFDFPDWPGRRVGAGARGRLDRRREPLTGPVVRRRTGRRASSRPLRPRGSRQVSKVGTVVSSGPTSSPTSVQPKIIPSAPSATRSAITRR